MYDQRTDFVGVEGVEGVATEPFKAPGKEA